MVHYSMINNNKVVLSIHVHIHIHIHSSIVLYTEYYIYLNNSITINSNINLDKPIFSTTKKSSTFLKNAEPLTV